jgi:hypothetical protein
VQLRLRERAPRPEHRVVGAEERELVLLDRVDGQEGDSADDRLLTAERGVERLVPDGDGTELDDRDALVVRELLAALRAVLLRGGREALAEDQLVTLDAAEVRVHVLDGELGALRPVRADEHLAALCVDRADHDRRELRICLAGRAADIRQVVRDRSTCRLPPEGDRDGDRQRGGGDSYDDRETPEWA